LLQERIEILILSAVEQLVGRLGVRMRAPRDRKMRVDELRPGCVHPLAIRSGTSPKSPSQVVGEQRHFVVSDGKFQGMIANTAPNGS